VLDKAKLLPSETECVLGSKQNYYWGNEAKCQRFWFFPQ